VCVCYVMQVRQQLAELCMYELNIMIEPFRIMEIIIITLSHEFPLFLGYLCKSLNGKINNFGRSIFMEMPLIHFEKSFNHQPSIRKYTQKNVKRTSQILYKIS